jgi:hypothetical protein
MEFLRIYHHARIRGLPEEGIFGVIPWEDTLLISGKKHTRRKVAPNGDNAALPFLWGRKGVAFVLVKIRKIAVRARGEFHVLPEYLQ